MPGAGDQAIFDDSAATNGYTVSWANSETAGSVLFSATTNSAFWNVGDGNTWTVNNSFMFDEGASGTAIGDIDGGTVAVTNASGTGLFSLGNNGTGGRGLLVMEEATITQSAPTLTVDQFNMTANSDFIWRGGTLTTLHGSSIALGSKTAFIIGTNVLGSIGTTPADWNMLGGTNTITYSGSGNTILAYRPSTVANVTVSGSNTLWSVGGTQLTIGNSGQGALVVSNGAHVVSPLAVLSANATSSKNNQVVVTGAGSRWDIRSSLGSVSDIGGPGLGTGNQLSVLDGGTVVVSNCDLRAGDATGANQNSITVSGGTLLMNGGSLSVGFHGVGNTMTINNNGAVVVNNGAMYVSASTSANNNSVTVSSGGSLIVTNSSHTGKITVVGGNAAAGNGTGSITLNGGTITADALAISQGSLSFFAFNGGAVNLTGTSTTTNGLANGNAPFTVGNGTDAAQLNVLGGSVCKAYNGLTVSASGALTGIGTFAGAVNNLGTISAGNSGMGALTFTTSLTLTPGSVLDFGIGGRSAGQFGQLVLANAALAVDGALDVNLLNGFTPSEGDMFQLLDLSSATSTSGVFASFNLPTLSGGLSWDTSQLLTTGDIEVVPEPSSIALAVGGCLLLMFGVRRRLN